MPEKKRVNVSQDNHAILNAGKLNLNGAHGTMLEQQQ
jgi:hypothetical protein